MSIEGCHSPKMDKVWNILAADDDGQSKCGLHLTLTETGFGDSEAGPSFVLYVVLLLHELCSLIYILFILINCFVILN